MTKCSPKLDLDRYVPLTDLFGRHDGAITVVMACGPSLRNFDWDRLTWSRKISIVTVGVNRIVKAFSPDYWFLTEARRIFNVFTRYIDASKTVVVTTPTHTLYDMAIKTKARYTIYVKNKKHCQTEGPFKCIMPVPCIQSRGTVSAGGLDFAYLLGASTTYLLGCDFALHPKDGTYYFDPDIMPTYKAMRHIYAETIGDSEYVWNHNLRYMARCIARWRDRHTHDRNVVFVTPSPALQSLGVPTINYDEFWNRLDG